MKSLFILGIPLFGFLLVVVFIIGVFLTDTPRSSSSTSLSAKEPLKGQNVATLRRPFGRVVVNSNLYDPLKIPIDRATLMSEQGEIVSFRNTEGEVNSTFSYLPESKTFVEHIDDQSHPVDIEGDHSVILYRERSSNNVIVATSQNRVIADEKGNPIRFKLMAKKV